MAAQCVEPGSLVEFADVYTPDWEDVIGVVEVNKLSYFYAGDPVDGHCEAGQILFIQNASDLGISNSFALSSDAGALLGGAILLVWAAGWAVRQISRVLRQS